MKTASEQKTYDLKNLEDSTYKTFTHPTYRDLAREYRGLLAGLAVTFALGLACAVFLAFQQNVATVFIVFMLFGIAVAVFANAETAMRRLMVKRGNEVEFWANRWFDMNVKEEVFKASGYLITDRSLCRNQFEALSPEGKKATVVLIGLHEEFVGMYVPGIGGYKIDERGVVMKVVR